MGNISHNRIRTEDKHDFKSTIRGYASEKIGTFKKRTVKVLTDVKEAGWGDLKSLIAPNNFKESIGGIKPSLQVAKALSGLFNCVVKAPVIIFKVITGIPVLLSKIVLDHKEEHNKFKESDVYKKFRICYLTQEIETELNSEKAGKDYSYINDLYKELQGYLTGETDKCALGEIKEINLENAKSVIEAIKSTPSYSESQKFVNEEAGSITKFRYNLVRFVDVFCSYGLSDLQSILMPNLLQKTIKNGATFGIIGSTIGAFIGLVTAGPAGMATGATIGLMVGTLIGVLKGIPEDFTAEHKEYKKEEWDTLKNKWTPAGMLKQFRLGLDYFVQYLNKEMNMSALMNIIAPNAFASTASHAITDFFVGGAIGGAIGAVTGGPAGAAAGAAIGGFCGLMLGFIIGSIDDFRTQHKDKYSDEAWKELMDDKSYTGVFKKVDMYVSWLYQKVGNDVAIDELRALLLPNFGSSVMDTAYILGAAGAFLGTLAGGPAGGLIGLIIGLGVGGVIGHLIDNQKEIEVLKKEIVEDKGFIEWLVKSSGFTEEAKKAWLTEECQARIVANGGLDKTDLKDIEIDSKKIDPNKLYDISRYYSEQGTTAGTIKNWRLNLLAGNEWINSLFGIETTKLYENASNLRGYVKNLSFVVSPIIDMAGASTETKDKVEEIDTISRIVALLGGAGLGVLESLYNGLSEKKTNEEVQETGKTPIEEKVIQETKTYEEVQETVTKEKVKVIKKKIQEIGIMNYPEPVEIDFHAINKIIKITKNSGVSLVPENAFKPFSGHEIVV